MTALRIVADSSLPKPHHSPSPHFATGLASTGANIEPWLVIGVVLIVVGVAALIAIWRLEKDKPAA